MNDENQYDGDVKFNQIIEQKRLTPQLVEKALFLKGSQLNRINQVSQFFCIGREKLLLLDRGAKEALKIPAPLSWHNAPNEAFFEAQIALNSLCKQFPEEYFFASINTNEGIVWILVVCMPHQAISVNEQSTTKTKDYVP